MKAKPLICFLNEINNEHIETTKKVLIGIKERAKLTNPEMFIALSVCLYKQRRTKGRQARIWRKRWVKVRDEIAERNTGLVYNVLVKFQKSDQDYALSEGMFALSRSIELFDPFRGICFSTYATNSIMRLISRSSQNEKKFLERNPFNIHSAMAEPFFVTSPIDDLSQSENITRIRNAVNKLPNMEKMVITHRFLRDKTSTLSELGRACSMTKEGVRLIQNKAINRLRELIPLE
jgi:RNA polymerase sigma factor (sigma-70 family)